MQVTETFSADKTTQNIYTNTNKSRDLDKNAFLRMLVLQLQHQDPMQPMQDREFIAQLAQFSSLEQMQNLSKQFEIFTSTQNRMQALSLIGREVTVADPESVEPVTGIVRAIKFIDNKPLLVVGEKELDLTNILSVK